MLSKCSLTMANYRPTMTHYTTMDADKYYKLLWGNSGFADAVLLLSTYQPGITYPRTWPSPCLASAKCDATVRCVLTWDCLARLQGTLQYNIQIDDNLVFLLQRLPSTGEPCQAPTSLVLPMVEPLPYCDTIVSRLPIWNCLARLRGTLQYNT